MIEFFVPGAPVAKGRGRATVVNGHARVYTPARTRDYENLVKSFARSAMGASEPLDMPVAVGLVVVLPIPASMTKRDKAHAEAGRLLPAKKPDLDNLVKSVSDGMNGIVLYDDKQICELHVSKRYGTKPGMHVRVEAL